MKHRRKLLMPPAIAVAAALFAAAPASAAQGGNPTSGSCGLGETVAHNAIQNPAGPGASEDARVSPLEVGCNGNG
jgi:hypothetical protein